MFDSYLVNITDKLPSFESISSEDFRSILSKAYLDLINYKTEIVDSTKYRSDNIVHLRKLADTFEYLGIFGKAPSVEIKTAACFIAAEALDLLTSILMNKEDKDAGEYLNNYEIALLESAFLYFISGYDSNSKKVIKNLNDSIARKELKEEIRWSLQQIIGIIVSSERSTDIIELVEEESLSSNNFNGIFLEIGRTANKYHAWLNGNKDISPANLIEDLKILLDIFKHNYNSFYALPLHMVKLLKEFIETTSTRSLFHRIPRPVKNPSDYDTFLMRMTVGNVHNKGQLFLWPSSIDFVEGCLPGPKTHSIISTPTGSGKSTIAKLAISHALEDGWVLYLAPTNALVLQIQNDLKKVTWPSKEVKVKSFIGDDEYTALNADRLLIDASEKNIYVMTPEKCALAMRLAPSFFSDCRLCIFDEFHEISSGTRGIIVDVILGSLLTISPFIKLQLISAMIENSQDIKEWLENASGYNVKIIDLKWRPSRTMKGVVGVDDREFKEAFKNAPLLPKAKTRRASSTNYHVLFGLQGAWQSDDIKEYKYGNIGAEFKFDFTEKSSPFESWVNKTMGSLSFHFGNHNMKTIGFFPKNKHYPFIVARDMDAMSINKELWTQQVDNLIRLATVELGMPTKLEELLAKGISVHTSLMTLSEKNLSELAFKSGLSKVMLATSTLSQGLNLPAEVVLLGGTELGDEFNGPREDPTLLTRKNTQFLNSIGRAGRAEFSSQGLALIIPSKPLGYYNAEKDVQTAKQRAWFLEYQDASQNIESSLTSFLDNLMADSVDVNLISEEELTLLPFFTASSPLPITVLNKTLGAHKIQKSIEVPISEIVAPVIEGIHSNFMEETGAQNWIYSAARKSGTTIFIAQEMVKVIEELKTPHIDEVLDWNIFTWSDYLLSILERMNPNTINSLLYSFKDFKNELTPKNNESFLYTDWTPSKDWFESWEKVKEYLKAYYSSKDLTELGTQIFPSLTVNNERTQGSFIPTTLKLMEYKGSFEKLSRYGSLLISLLEEIWKDEESKEEVPVPFHLSMLPLAIKIGIANINSLAWYKYGYRNRFVALVLKDITETNILYEDTENEVFLKIKRDKTVLQEYDEETLVEKLSKTDFTELEIHTFVSFLNVH